MRQALFFIVFQLLPALSLASCDTDASTCTGDGCDLDFTRGGNDAGDSTDSSSESEADTGGEGDLVCCNCVCYTIINPTLGTEEQEEVLISGKDISCESECRAACARMNWNIQRYYRIPCPE
jgi:hypothetical protein